MVAARRLLFFVLPAAFALAFWLGYRAPDAPAPVAWPTHGVVAPTPSRAAAPGGEAPRVAAPAAASAEPVRATQARLRRLLPPFPGVKSVVGVGETMDMQGLPMAVAAFETKRDPLEILAFYARYFDDRRWPRSDVKLSFDLIGDPGISATLPDELLQVSVIIQEQPGDEVRTVLLAVADMAALIRGGGPATAGDFPSYPGAHAAVLRLPSEGSLAFTVTFETRDEADRVRAFLREGFARQGYVPARDEGDGPGLMRFQAEGRQWEVAVLATDEATSVTAHGRLRSAR